MANVVGRDILVRMLGDVDELKRSQAAMGQAIAELRVSEVRASGAIETIQFAVGELQEAVRRLDSSQRELALAFRGRAEGLRVIAEHVENGQRLFTKLHGSIEALIEQAGDVEARVDDHELRLQALETKSSA